MYKFYTAIFVRVRFQLFQESHYKMFNTNFYLEQYAIVVFSPTSAATHKKTDNIRYRRIFCNTFVFCFGISDDSSDGQIHFTKIS